MILRYTRLRLRRRFRSRQKKVAGISFSANKHLDRHIFRRWHNFKYAGRFALGWMGLMIVLIMAVIFQTVTLGNHYLLVQPVSGGVYTEGIVGQFSNANPIYATNDVDSSVSKILFDSLLTYDAADNLVSDLAESWEVDDKGLVYTVKLKSDLVWHDGHVLDSDDVVFTFKTIQNPDAKSPLMSSWSGIKIDKVDSKTINFTLPNAYSPFPHSLTVGLIPDHILKDVPAVQLRSAGFNTTNPVGTGPFLWKGIVKDSSGEAETIQLVKFEKYHDGAPLLDSLAIKTFPDSNTLIKALDSKKVITAAGLDVADKDYEPDYRLTSFNLMSANMLFLKTTSPVLSDIKVRQALIKGTNQKEIIDKIGYPAIPVREPVLNSQPVYNPDLTQLAYDATAANKHLEDAGWRIENGQTYRTKDGKQLVLNLAYENKRDFALISEIMQRQWAAIGVNLAVDVSRDESDSRKYIDDHTYDVLLYGISIGTDPDVYVYWHSSQISPDSQTRLNLSEYKSLVADIALESGRSRSDMQLRIAKYKPFLEAWRNDVPAIGLYQPRYLYVSNQKIYGLEAVNINTSSDRFNNVNKWMINVSREPSK